MSRFHRFLILFLTLSLLFAACRPQTADRRPQADGGRLTVDGGQPTVPSPTFTLSPSPTSTETPIPRLSFESLGLSAETQALLKRQGWDITWEYGRVGDSPQPARYLIRQRAFDEASQSFTFQLTHEIGSIDLEGNLRFTATQYSASENEDGTWKDTSTTQDIVVDLKNLPKNPDLIIQQQLDENGNPISFQEKLKTPGFHLLETKNPAFEKTGILTLTYLDENGIPQTVIYNRKLNFLQIPELSTDLLHPTPIPIEAVHSLAALQFILLRYGDGEPFPMEAINEPPQWAIQFHYNDNGTKDAVLIPHNGHRDRYIRFIGEGKDSLKIPWFMILLPNGTAYPSAPVEIFNPKDPQNPKDGNEKLLLFPVFLGKMSYPQRYFFNLQYLTYEKFNALFKERRIYLAQEGGYFSKTNIGKWTDFYDPASLDSLLGMEGKDENDGYGKLGYNIGYVVGNRFSLLSSSNTIIETNPLVHPALIQELIKFQGKVFVISP
jgi:hypothetical protein